MYIRQFTFALTFLSCLCVVTRLVWKVGDFLGYCWSSRRQLTNIWLSSDKEYIVFLLWIRRLKKINLEIAIQAVLSLYAYSFLENHDAWESLLLLTLSFLLRSEDASRQVLHCDYYLPGKKLAPYPSPDSSICLLHSLLCLAVIQIWNLFGGLGFFIFLIFHASRHHNTDSTTIICACKTEGQILYSAVLSWPLYLREL